MSVAAADLAVESVPAYDWHPPRLCSRGEDAVELAASAGLHLDPWQRLALDRILSEDDAGMPAAFEAAVVIARQNGKGSVLEALTLYWLLVERVDLVLHSAHEFKTAAEAFRRIVTLLRGSPDLWLEVDRVLTGAGSEAVEFVDGQRLRFVARSKGSGRGFTADKVILDEAMFLGVDEMSALLPTLSTREAAQVVYTASAPMSTSLVLHSVIRRGRRLNDPTLAYVEWRAPGSMADPGCEQEQCLHALDTPGCALDREDHWFAANPRVGLDFIRKERRALSPAGFARERLGWEDPLDTEISVDLAAWTELADEASRPRPRPVALAVDVAPGLTSAAVAAAGYRPDGLVHVELLAHRPGVAWLGEFLAGRQKATGGRVWHVGGTSPVNAVVPDWPQHLDVEAMTVTEYAAACGALDAMVRDRRLRHLGDPILAGALGGAARKDVGDGAWVLRRSASLVDICPAVAVAVAVRGLVSLPASVGEPLVAWR